MAYNPFEFGISREDLTRSQVIARSPRAPASATTDTPDTRVGITPGIKSVKNPLPSRGVIKKKDTSHIERAGGNVKRFKQLKVRRPDIKREKSSFRKLPEPIAPIPVYTSMRPIEQGREIFTFDPRKDTAVQDLSFYRDTITSIQEEPFDPRHQRTGRTFLTQLLTLFGIS